MSESSVDNALVSQVLKGDKEAFGVLVLKYQGSLRRLIQPIVRDRSAAMDVVQEAFIAAYRSLGNFQGNSSFYTWVYRIAVNKAKNYLKYQGRRPPSQDLEISDIFLCDTLRTVDLSGPDQHAQRDEIQTAVIDAVNQLPEELRVSMILREMAGLTYHEIASIMACPIGTVRSRIFRARTAVDENIKPILDGE